MEALDHSSHLRGRGSWFQINGWVLVNVRCLGWSENSFTTFVFLRFRFVLE